MKNCLPKKLNEQCFAARKILIDTVIEEIEKVVLKGIQFVFRDFSYNYAYFDNFYVSGFRFEEPNAILDSWLEICKYRNVDCNIDFWHIHGSSKTIMFEFRKNSLLYAFFGWIQLCRFRWKNRYCRNCWWITFCRWKSCWLRHWQKSYSCSLWRIISITIKLDSKREVLANLGYRSFYWNGRTSKHFPLKAQISGITDRARRWKKRNQQFFKNQAFPTMYFDRNGLSTSGKVSFLASIKRIYRSSWGKRILNFQN